MNTAAPHHDEIVVPRPVIWLTLALVVFTILATATARLTQRGVTHEDLLVPRREASFRVVQSFSGPVVAVLAGGRAVTLAQAGEERLPRLILRSVAAIRERDGVDQAAPVKLIELAGGERLIVDPATHRTLRLAAFGRENQRMFDPLFDGAGQ